MSRLIAIGDIHGCNLTFQAILAQIQPTKTDQIVLLGDYVDRGKDSKGVFDTIFDYQAAGYQFHCLVGNHEAMMLQTYDYKHHSPHISQADKEADLAEWIRCGGKQTLENFDFLNPNSEENPYINYCRTELSKNVAAGKFLFVHAGFNFESETTFQNDIQSMVWIRNWYEKINYELLGNRYIIHGHTPILLSETRKMIENWDKNRYVNLDNGCVYAGRANFDDKGGQYGHLLAFEVHSRHLWVQNFVG